ncbi:MAG: nuclear transport factor 2 family protein [Rhizobiaceae bacterium]|nr:nuclear transport factor 2 family protein [Rhizobiaceae bacterium]
MNAPADLAALARRIDRIESRTAIAELCTTYARACDDRDMALLGSLFTEDCTFESRDGSRFHTGRHAIVEMYKVRFRALGPTYHWTHDLVVRFDEADDDLARGQLLGHAECFRNGQAMVAAMRYDDTYRREGGAWRIHRRMLSYFYYMPVGEYAEGLGSPMRMRAYGDRRPADYPEKLPTWTTWEQA